jgi:L-Ala-D/L-Glu epimerase
VRLSYTSYRLKCTHPFGISRSTYNFYDRVFIYLEQDGFIGRGEATPSERYNESIPQILERLKNKIIFPKSVSSIDRVAEIIDGYTFDIKSLRSAFINALYDWWTQKNNISLYDYFNYNGNINKPTSFTIAIGDFEKLAQKIDEAKNYKILKVKLGTENDKEIITEIRKHTDKPIRVDANEGWDSDTAIEMINWLSGRNVELVEQPLPATNLDKMVDLKKHSSLPLIADENCHISADIYKLVDGFDGINIKLAKCGGVDEAVKMINIAKKYNLKIMLGCMAESSIGITALAQLASRADYLDLDGNLLINNDPYDGMQIVDGIPTISNSSGLGLNLINNYKNEFPELK